MRKNTKRLTDEQRKLVEDNHDLIYWYMHKYRLTEDFYYILALGLCMAARNYNSDLGSFSTIAHQYMRREVNRFFDHQKRLCRDNPVGDDISLGSVIAQGDDVLTLGDVLPAACNLEQDAENREVLRTLESRLQELPERQRHILSLRWAGYDSTEIGAIVGCSRQNVWAIIKAWEKRVLEGLYD